MDEHKDTISYIVYESSMARQERTIKRLIIALIFTVVLMFTCNALWLLAWSSYDYSDAVSDESVVVDGSGGVANYIGNDNSGEVNYAEDHSTKDNQDTNQN